MIDVLEVCLNNFVALPSVAYINYKNFYLTCLGLYRTHNLNAIIMTLTGMAALYLQGC